MAKKKVKGAKKKVISIPISEPQRAIRLPSGPSGIPGSYREGYKQVNHPNQDGPEAISEADISDNWRNNRQSDIMDSSYSQNIQRDTTRGLLADGPEAVSVADASDNWRQNRQLDGMDSSYNQNIRRDITRGLLADGPEAVSDADVSDNWRQNRQLDRIDSSYNQNIRHDGLLADAPEAISEADLSDNWRPNRQLDGMDSSYNKNIRRDVTRDIDSSPSAADSSPFQRSTSAQTQSVSYPSRTEKRSFDEPFVTGEADRSENWRNSTLNSDKHAQSFSEKRNMRFSDSFSQADTDPSQRRDGNPRISNFVGSMRGSNRSPNKLASQRYPNLDEADKRYRPQLNDKFYPRSSEPVLQINPDGLKTSKSQSNGRDSSSNRVESAKIIKQNGLTPPVDESKQNNTIGNHELAIASQKPKSSKSQQPVGLPPISQKSSEQIFDASKSSTTKTSTENPPKKDFALAVDTVSASITSNTDTASDKSALIPVKRGLEPKNEEMKYREQKKETCASSLSNVIENKTTSKSDAVNASGLFGNAPPRRDPNQLKKNDFVLSVDTVSASFTSKTDTAGDKSAFIPVKRGQESKKEEMKDREQTKDTGASSSKIIGNKTTPKSGAVTASGLFGNAAPRQDPNQFKNRPAQINSGQVKAKSKADEKTKSSQCLKTKNRFENALKNDLSTLKFEEWCIGVKSIDLIENRADETKKTSVQSDSASLFSKEAHLNEEFTSEERLTSFIDLTVRSQHEDVLNIKQISSVLKERFGDQSPKILIEVLIRGKAKMGERKIEKKFRSKKLDVSSLLNLSNDDANLLLDQKNLGCLKNKIDIASRINRAVKQGKNSSEILEIIKENRIEGRIIEPDIAENVAMDAFHKYFKNVELNIDSDSGLGDHKEILSYVCESKENQIEILNCAVKIQFEKDKNHVQSTLSGLFKDLYNHKIITLAGLIDWRLAVPINPTKELRQSKMQALLATNSLITDLEEQSFQRINNEYEEDDEEDSDYEIPGIPRNANYDD